MFSQEQINKLTANDSVLLALVPTWDAGEETRLLAPHGEFTIGSDRTCELPVYLNGIAPRHCDIQFGQNGATISPREACEVWLNESRVTRPRDLRTGDSLAIGPATFKIEHRRKGIVSRVFRGRTTTHTSSAQRVVSAPASTAPLSVATSSDDSVKKRRADIPREPATTASQNDERVSSLLEWQHNLEQRCADLDSRSQELATLQRQMFDRQARFEQRTADFESQQREELQRLREEQETVSANVLKDLMACAENLQQREEELESLRLEVHSQQKEVVARQAELQKLEQEVATTQRSLENQAKVQEELNSLRESLAARETSLAEKEAAFAACQREFQNEVDAFQKRQDDARRLHQQQLDAQADHIANAEQLRVELDAKEAALAVERENLRREADEFALARELVENERAELSHRRSALNESEAKLQQQQLRATDLDERAESLQASENALNVEKSSVEKRSSDLAEQESRLQDVQQVVQLERETTDELKKELEIRTAALADREAALKYREAEIAATLSTIEEQQKETDAETARLSDEYDQLDTEREDHARRLAEWQSHAEKQNEAVNERAENVNKLEAELQRRAEELAIATEKLANAEAMSAQNSAAQAQEAELRAWEAELQSRQDEIAERVLGLKRIIAESTPSASNTAMPAMSVAESHQSAEQLEDARRQVEQLTAQRDELATALDELKAAFETVRDELIAREETEDSDQASDDGTAQLLAEANSTLDERTAEVAELKTSIDKQQDRLTELEASLRDANENFALEKREFEQQLESVAAVSGEGPSGDEEALLEQVNELRSQLETAKSEGPAEAFSEGDSTDQYVQIIGELKAELETARKQLDELREQSATPENGTDKASEEQLSLIAELTSRLEQQEADNEKLRQQQAGGIQPSETGTDELNTLHRELDSRTVVLDTREEELRERLRLVEQSEGEIETQRRELLEARQQLELARAEIQIAMDQTPDPAAEPTDFSEPALPSAVDLMPSDSEPASEQEPETDSGSAFESEIDVTPAEQPASPAVRSELAELFGIAAGDSSFNSSEDTCDLPAVDDYSQEKAAAVSMSFSQAENVLVEAPPQPEIEEVEAENEEDGDDFVAKYMEQLLARNRANAGENLPEELTNASGRPSSSSGQSSPSTIVAPPAAKEETGAPQTKSFIDAYMSGEFGQSAADAPPAPAATQSAAPVAPSAPRQKIDLDALRNDMDSFRQLSTKSVENALASHAKRQEKGGISTRTLIVTVLGMVCLFMVCAAFMDVIQFGLTVWLSIAAFVVACGELGVKILMVNQKVKQSSASLTNGVADDVSEPPIQAAPTPASEQTVAHEELESTGAANAVDAIGASDLPDTTPSNSPANDEDQYFEL